VILVSFCPLNPHHAVCKTIPQNSPSVTFHLAFLCRTISPFGLLLRRRGTPGPLDDVRSCLSKSWSRSPSYDFSSQSPSARGLRHLLWNLHFPLYSNTHFPQVSFRLGLDLSLPGSIIFWMFRLSMAFFCPGASRDVRFLFFHCQVGSSCTYNSLVSVGKNSDHGADLFTPPLRSSKFLGAFTGRGFSIG